MSNDLGVGHAEAIAPAFSQVLDEAGVEPAQIKRVGVTVGPGSFMGQRVGIAFAKGLVMGTGAQTVALTTLEAIAEGAGYPVLVLIDARRNQVYAQAFDDKGAPTGQAALISAEEARQRMVDVARVAGSGVSAADPGHNAIGATNPSAQALLSLTEQRHASPLKTLYLRAPDAKVPTRVPL